MQQDHPEQTEWFVSWFQHPLYLKLYHHRDHNEAKLTVETLIKLTGLAQGSQVLDIACGAGRHAVEFAKHGMMVSANDLSEFLIQETKLLASTTNCQMTFSQVDMRKISYYQSFDMVVQLFTSFGYFKTQADDQTVLKRVFQALKPGGWYILDFLNSKKVQETLIEKNEKIIDDLTVSEQRTIDNGRIKKTISISQAMETLTFTESVKLYSPNDLREMLTKEGFKIQIECGNYHGEPFDAIHSARFIALAKKPN